MHNKSKKLAFYSVNKLCVRSCGPQHVTAPTSGDMNSCTQNSLMTFTFDILTLQLVWNVTRGTDNLPANFGIVARFR